MRLFVGPAVRLYSVWKRVFIVFDAERLSLRSEHLPSEIPIVNVGGWAANWTSLAHSGLTMAERNPNTLMQLPSADDTFDFLFKVVLIGDCGTGKTCVVQRFKTGNYIERHGNTIGVDFSMKTIGIDGKRVKVSMTNGDPFDELVLTYLVGSPIRSDTNLGYSRPGAVPHHYAELLPFGQRRHNR